MLILRSSLSEAIGLLRRKAPTRKSARCGVGLAVLLSIAAGAAQADTAAGRDAYDKGDYPRAMNEWQGAADRGEAAAQLGLGSLYEFGQGLKQDYKRGVYWYEKAARQDNVEAQYRIGLLYSAGGDNLDRDLVEAYKWLTLASRSQGVWGSLAGDLRSQLDKVLTASDREQGRRRAEDWRRGPPPDQVAAAVTNPVPPPQPAAPPPQPAFQPPIQPGSEKGGKPGAPTSCSPPGWPGPPLPCGPNGAALPPIPEVTHTAPDSGKPPPPQPVSIPVPIPVTPPPPPAPPQRSAVDELQDAVKDLDCASLQVRAAGTGATITGAVPSMDGRTKLAQLAAKFFPGGKADLNVEIVPSPLCGVLVELDSIRAAGLATDNGVTVRLVNPAPRLREGDLIKVEVKAPAYAVNLRIDYFSLDGQVLHMWPNADEAAIRLPAGATKLFGDPKSGKTYNAGGAPFGTEMISVIATTQPLDMNGTRPQVELATDYLRDVEGALSHVRVGSGTPSVIGSTLIRTSAR